MENVELKVDPIKHDLSLAKKYLKENNYKFQSIPNKFKEKKCLDFKKDDISYKVTVNDDGELCQQSLDKTIDGNRECLLEILETNAKLFAQLELMIRNISEDESLANLKLIQQCVRTEKDILSTNIGCFVLSFHGHCPLSELGLVNNFIREGKPFLIEATPITAAVATLFVQICREAGFMVNLIFADHDNIIRWYEPGQCTGVVTETADIDSAIETFISSFSKKPWSINRVLVQENVYDLFKKSLEWKCRILKSQQELPDDINNMSSAVHTVDQKIFLLDYLGDAALAEKDGIILVEAFRTDTELISLLKVEKPFCITLWCNNITMANKIAFSTNASYTWINDYCSFEGPGEISQAFYSGMVEYPSLEEIKGRSWIDLDELSQKLLNNTSSIIKELGQQLKEPFFKGFKNVSLEKQGLSIVYGDIADIVYVEGQEKSNEVKENIIKRIAVAAQLKRVILFDINKDYRELFNFLDELKLPVMLSRIALYYVFALYKTRCVWTRFPNIV